MSASPRVVYVHTPQEMIAHFERIRLDERIRLEKYEQLQLALKKAPLLIRYAQFAEYAAWKADTAGVGKGADRVDGRLTTDGRYKPPFKVWRVGSSPLHGAGLFAKRDIARGKVILSEVPLIEQHGVDDTAHGNSADVAFHKQVLKRVRTMNEEEQKALLRLMAANQYDVSDIHTVEELQHNLDGHERDNQTPDRTSEELMSRISTAQQIATTFKQHTYPFCGTGSTRRLFRHVSMLNHNCDPTAEAVWNPETGRLVVRAIQNISKTDEITISYVDPHSIRSDRWRELGFQCCCATCRRRDEAVRESDNIRRKVGDALTVLRNFRARYFPATEEAKVPMAIARRLCADHDLVLVRAAIKVVATDSPDAEIFEKVYCSDLALCNEMEYVGWMAQVANPANTYTRPELLEIATGIKLNQFEQLALTFGVEHPRTRNVLGRLVRMTKGNESALKGVSAKLAEFGWELEYDVPLRDKIEPITNLEWDEEDAGVRSWDVVLGV